MANFTNLPLNDSEVLFLKALVEQKVRFMVVGLSAAAMQGAPVVTQDVDLWFENLHSPELAAALRQSGVAYVPPMEMNPPMFAGAGVEQLDIVLRMDGLKSFIEEYVNCKEVHLADLKLKVLSLERILHSKETARRPKDQLVIPVLRDTIATKVDLTEHH